MICKPCRQRADHSTTGCGRSCGDAGCSCQHRGDDGGASVPATPPLRPVAPSECAA